MDQSDLADLADLNVNTIRSMEASASGPIAGRAANVHAVQRTLEQAGVEFLNHGQPGVRLRPAGEIGPKPVGPATDAVDAMDAAISRDRKPRQNKDGVRLASVKETGEEVPQEQWERFEAANKKPKR